MTPSSIAAARLSPTRPRRAARTSTVEGAPGQWEKGPAADRMRRWEI